jgi:FkbM family methyltransferase
MMKGLYYSVVARSKLVARSNSLAALRRALRRLPLLGGALLAAKRSAARVLLPGELTWVQVESGLAQGLWLLLDLDIEGGYWIGAYETKVQDRLRRLCAPGSVFYDVGTSLGFFSLAVAHRVGPQGKVFGFDPEPENTRRFRQMIVRNSFQDCVTVVDAAAWSYSRDEISFQRGGRQRTYGGVVADGVRPVLAEGEMRVVKAVSLDDFAGQGHPAPDVIKIDVEGAECEVLRGARQIFSRAKPALICEVHHSEAADWIANWLAEVKYVAEWHVPDELFPRLLFAEAAPPVSPQVAIRP